MKQRTVFGIPCPWSGDENDPVPWTYVPWVRAYWFTRRLRHRLGLHDWDVRAVDQRLRCTWCGAFS